MLITMLKKHYRSSNLLRYQKQRQTQQGWHGAGVGQSSCVSTRGCVPSSYTIVSIRVLVHQKKTSNPMQPCVPREFYRRTSIIAYPRDRRILCMLTGYAIIEVRLYASFQLPPLSTEPTSNYSSGTTQASGLYPNS